MQDRAVIIEKLFNQFIDVQSPDYIQLDPCAVAVCQERYRVGLEKEDLPTDLLKELEDCVQAKLEALLPDYFQSKEYYSACRKPNGFLWRVIKLSRLSYTSCCLLLIRVTGPLLMMFDNGDLDCVPHFSRVNRQRFQAMCQALEKHLFSLKEKLHVIGYSCKEMCTRETIRESHATIALASRHHHNLPNLIRYHNGPIHLAANTTMYKNY